MRSWAWVRTRAATLPRAAIMMIRPDRVRRAGEAASAAIGMHDVSAFGLELTSSAGTSRSPGGGASACARPNRRSNGRRRQGITPAASSTEKVPRHEPLSALDARFPLSSTVYDTPCVTFTRRSAV